MSQKTLLPIALVAAVALAGLFAWLYVGHLHWEKDVLTVEHQSEIDLLNKSHEIDQLNSDMQQFKDDRDEYATNRELVDQLQREVKDAESLSALRGEKIEQLLEAKGSMLVERDKALRDMENLQTRIDGLRRQIESSENMFDTSSEEVILLKDQIKDLKVQCTQLEDIAERQAEIVRDLTLDLDSARAGLAAARENGSNTTANGNQPDEHIQPIVPANTGIVADRTNPEGTPDITSTVLAVGDEFAVIGVGTDRGIEKGWFFYVFREGKIIGVVRVDELHPTMSRAEILMNGDAQPRLQEGDLLHTVNEAPLAGSSE